jgi:hypothetical protein
VFHPSHLKQRIRASWALRSLSLGLVSTIGLLGAGAAQSAAATGTLVNNQPCNENALTHPFLRWHDESAYELAPGGDIEGSLSNWTLTGGAARVAGSEPFDATGSPGSYSLALPPGATAQTPFTCVDAAYPTLRFFTANSSLLGVALVQVVYKTQLGSLVVPVGVVALSNQWQPSLTALTASVAASLTSDGTAQMAIRFTAVTGTTKIDDIYIDPRMH